MVFGPDGQPRYVIASTGGFLGLGDDRVPIRWKDLRVTAEPYRDTFVLAVDERPFEDAGQRFDRYWNEAGVGQNR